MLLCFAYVIVSILLSESFHPLSYCSPCLVSVLIVLLSSIFIVVHLKVCSNRNKKSDVAKTVGIGLIS